MRLLDTDVCVDIRRGYPPALAWLAALTEAPEISGFVMLELMRGCANQREMRRLQRDMALFRIHWPTVEDGARALATYARAYLTHRLGILDVMIGENAVGLGATLCTFNVRHFRSVPGLTTEQPYGR